MHAEITGERERERERKSTREGAHGSNWLVKRLNICTHGLAENEGGRKNERSEVLARGDGGGGLTEKDILLNEKVTWKYSIYFMTSSLHHIPK